MGFDNECIQNIQSLAGEYFCPVCRLLVYPDEALYTQCTHLYCKPCLAYVVSTTRICPYDGYPVSEADTKPVTEANKALAETIGRIAVNCLYHRSGCTWQGTLSETTAHCAGCAFGNSPVVCNRCGTQIVHRQVQEHAQICPGEQPLAQQAENPTAAAEQNQAATQAGVPASQSQPSEAAAAPAAGQVQNQGTPNVQAQAMPQVAQTPEQWYQQQQQYYQQYYQQYPGYDPYQQQYQQYIQYQQQLQAHPQQVIQGQPQPQPFNQPQSQPQPQNQVQPQPQAPLQGQPQAPAQPQPQTQAQPHPHLQPQVAAQPQIQAQVLQQQPNAPVQSHPQMQPQSHMPPLAQQQVGHSHPQGQPHLQSLPQQHPQMTQHPQPHPQMQHPQPHPHPQSHPRPQQPQPQPQAFPQPHLQHHPQLQHQLQPHPQPHHPPQSQPQPQHPAAHAVTGHPSYPQPQPYQQTPAGTPQQPVHIHPQQQGVPHQMMQHPVQMQSQFPSQQPSQMRPPHNPPPHSHVPQQLPQQAVMMPMQGPHPHVPPVQQQQLAHHPGQQIHNQPVMQLSQQQLLPHQQPHFPQHQAHAPVHQPQLFPGQAPGQQTPFALPQPIQPQQSLRPQGLPSQQQVHSHSQMQQNIPPAQGLATHHSSSPAGRPMVPNQAVMHQPLNHTAIGQDAAHGVTKVVQPGAGQPSSSQGILSWTNNRPQLVSDQQPGPLQQSLLPRPDIQSIPHTGKNALASAAQATLKPVFSENQGDSVSGKAGQVPKLDADGTNANVSGTCNEMAPPSELKIPKSENDLKSSEGEENIVGGSDDRSGRPDHVVSEIESSLKHGKDLESLEKDEDSEEPVIKQMVKEETSEKLEPTEAENDEKEGEASQHAIKEVHDGPAHRSLSSLPVENLEGKVSRPWADGSGSMQSHPGTDKGLQGQAMGPVPERNMHGPPHPPNVGPGYDRAASNPGYQDRNLPQFPHHGSVLDEHRGLLSPGGMPAKNFVQPSHLAPVSDQERYHQLPMPYGPSPRMQDRVHQRPPAPDGMLPPPMPLPAPNHERNFQLHGPPMVQTRPQGHNPLESFPQHQQGQPSIAQEQFQTPMTKQPHGSFPSEVPSGGLPGRGMPALLGREPSLLGPPQSFELYPGGPHGHRQGLMPPPYAGSQRTSQGEPLSGVPPGAFDSAGSMMPRGPIGLEGQMSRPRPANPIEAEMFANKRPSFFEGKGASGGMQDTPFLHGFPEERFKPFPEERHKLGLEEGFKPHAEERFKPFPLDSGRRAIDRREFEEDLKQFPRPANLDGENMPRPLDRGPHTFGDRPSHVLSHDIGLKSDGSAGVPSGSAFPVTGDRLRTMSLPDNLGRNTDPSGARSDFLRHIAEFGRQPARSPGREIPGLPSSRYGNSPGRDPHGFGERWSGALPAHLRRGELDGPGSLRINEHLGSGRPPHLRSGDMVGPDLLPMHLRSGEPLGPGSLLNHMRNGEPRNLPGHLHVGEPLGPGQLRMGEPTTFGGIPSHLRMGGPGHLSSHLRIGESVGGGNFPSHLRIGEPGFGGGFPMQGFQGPQGDMESFDNLRKRKPGSTGWCRICKIDCESVEGLELHSQTREHQKMAMEMVLSIKQGNAKKQKLSSEDHVSREDANKKKKTSFEGRGTRN